jgi:DNA polymerase/3'-5' exonuclease PolX
MAGSVMLAKEYEAGMTLKNDTSKFAQPPLGWYMSEKFDGYRALFRYEEGPQNGKPVGKFYSRQGKPFFPPHWFMESMPPPNLLGSKILDGELWAGRDNFQLMGIVRKKKPIAEEWLNISYQVYDITNGEGGFVKRLKDLKRITNFTEKAFQIKIKQVDYFLPTQIVISCPLVFAKQQKITSQKQMKTNYQEVLDNKGEGIMMKHPLSTYDNGRSNHMLKYKPAYDREAIIIGYKGGVGKYDGLLGSFICRPLMNHDTYMSVDLDDDHIFTLSGMNDDIRNSYNESHPVDTIITYECSGFTDKGVPRFGRYQRIRHDVIIKEHSVNEGERDYLDKTLIIFQKMLGHYKSEGDALRSKTYMKVIKALLLLETDKDLEPTKLKSCDGIGQGTCTRIKEIIDTGTLQEYEKIKNYISPTAEFLKIHGVGKGKASDLVSLGFKTIDDIRNYTDINEILNATQMKGLKYFDDIQERIPYAEIQKHEIILKKTLSEIDPEAELTIAGSYRRKKDTSGDIDILLKATKKKTYDRFIDILKESSVIIEDLARGTKKYMGLAKGIDTSCVRRIDIMYTKVEEYPFAVLYFTGSCEFNQRMRADALIMGYTMNEYSLKSLSGEKMEEVFITEKDIFKFLNYEYLEPEMRIQ